jgi:hypothetical protein
MFVVITPNYKYSQSAPDIFILTGTEARRAFGIVGSNIGFNI